MEERGKVFYEKLAERMVDANVKKLCQSLAKSEIQHKELIEKTLYQWLPLPSDKESLYLIEEEARRENIFLTSA